MMLFMMVQMVTTVLNHDKVWLGLFSGDITKPRTHFRLTGDKHDHFDDSDDDDDGCDGNDDVGDDRDDDHDDDGDGNSMLTLRSPEHTSDILVTGFLKYRSHFTS